MTPDQETLELSRLPGRPPTKSSWIWSQFLAEIIPGAFWIPSQEKEKIPASEAAVERSFCNGRDMIGLRRFSLSSETMRQLVLLRDAILKRRPRT